MEEAFVAVRVSVRCVWLGASLGRLPDDLIEQIADDGMRWGGNTDRVACLDQPEDGLCCSERLPGARRTLDWQIRTVQPEDDPMGGFAGWLSVVT